jgi:hypothetical protein
MSHKIIRNRSESCCGGLWIAGSVLKLAQAAGGAKESLR